MSLKDKIFEKDKGFHKTPKLLLIKDVKEAVKKLTDLLVNEWEIDDEEVERQLIKIFGDFK